MAENQPAMEEPSPLRCLLKVVGILALSAAALYVALFIFAVVVLTFGWKSFDDNEREYRRQMERPEQEQGASVGVETQD